VQAHYPSPLVSSRQIASLEAPAGGVTSAGGLKYGCAERGFVERQCFARGVYPQFCWMLVIAAPRSGMRLVVVEPPGMFDPSFPEEAPRVEAAGAMPMSQFSGETTSSGSTRGLPGCHLEAPRVTSSPHDSG
jgi:hypothetical protein